MPNFALSAKRRRALRDRAVPVFALTLIAALPLVEPLNVRLPPVPPLTPKLGVAVKLAAFDPLELMICPAAPTLYVIANVPAVVMGEPVTDKNEGTDAATEVTVPPPPPEPLAAAVMRP